MEFPAIFNQRFPKYTKQVQADTVQINLLDCLVIFLLQLLMLVAIGHIFSFVSLFYTLGVLLMKVKPYHIVRQVKMARWFSTALILCDISIFSSLSFMITFHLLSGTVR